MNNDYLPISIQQKIRKTLSILSFPLYMELLSNADPTLSSIHFRYRDDSFQAPSRNLSSRTKERNCLNRLFAGNIFNSFSNRNEKRRIQNDDIFANSTGPPCTSQWREFFISLPYCCRKYRRHRNFFFGRNKEKFPCNVILNSI